MRTVFSSLALVGLLLRGAGAAGAAKPSDTELIEVYYPGWENPHLTVSILGGASVAQETLAAAQAAIAI